MGTNGIPSITPVSTILSKSKPQFWPRCKDADVLVVEEKLFNEASVKEFGGVKYRCSVISVTHDLLTEDEKAVNEFTKLINSFLRRVISPRTPFSGYKCGKTAISALTKKFRDEFTATLSKGRIGYQVLKEGKAHVVECYIAASGPDLSTYEGVTSIDFHWYAECLKDGKTVRRPIVQVFTSNYNK